MGSRKIITSAVCLIVVQICRVNATVCSEPCPTSAISNPSFCGSQFVIPAIIKPVLQSEPITAPIVPDFGCGMSGSYSGYSAPPIIIEEGGSSGNDFLLPLILMFALKNMGGTGRNNGAFSNFGNVASGYAVGCGGGFNGVAGIGGGYSSGGYNGFGGYGGCGGILGGYGGICGGYGGGCGGCGGGCGGCGGGCGGYGGGCGGYGGVCGGCGGGCGGSSGYNGYGGCSGCGGYSGCGCNNYPYSNSDSFCGSGCNDINLIIKTDCCNASSS